MPQTQGIHSLFEDKKIRFLLKCVAVALLLVLAVPAVTVNWSICHDSILGIVSGRFFAEYRFDVIYSSGAFDQGGLTKLVIFIFVMELLAVLCYALAVSISRLRWWRVVCITMVLAFFVAPVGMNLLYSWELARYIAVMGITPSRITGVRFAILFLFVPLVCLTGCFIGAKSIKRMAITIGTCLLVAYMMFMTVDAAARKSVSCHPRPKLCQPNMVWVPSTPETSSDYGLKEILFYY